MNEQERKRAFFLFIVMRGDWALYLHWLANHANLNGVSEELRR
jgi:hypothetical protein